MHESSLFSALRHCISMHGECTEKSALEQDNNIKLFYSFLMNGLNFSSSRDFSLLKQIRERDDSSRLPLIVLACP